MVRVLLVAQHANPEWGSEPLIGWRWFQSLRRRAEVTLVTHVRNRGALERAAERMGEAFLPRIEFVDTERTAAWVAKWNRRLWGAAAPVNKLILETVAQRAFDKEATRIARRIHREQRIDVIHRVSPISPRFPTRLVSVGVPVVLGPVNGGMRTLTGFDEVAREEREGVLSARPLARLLDPLARTWRGASAVFAASETARAALPRCVQDRVTVLSENAVDLAAFRAMPDRTGPGLRVLFLGRLLRYKGAAHVIEAVARLGATRDVRLDVVGEGPDAERLMQLTKDLGVEDRVTFHGPCAVEDVPRWMERSDVYALPSVRESGGSTLLEAMAAAKPVITVAHGGPRETVNSSVGYAVCPRSPRELSALVTEALRELYDDEALRRRKGLAAREHVRAAFTWEHKIGVACDAYRRCIDGEARRSDTDRGGERAFRDGIPQGGATSLGRPGSA